MSKAAVRLVVAACAGVVAIGSAGPAWAVDKSWAAKSGGNFERATSWAPRGAPGVNDRAIFDLTGRKGATASYTVKFNSDPTNLSAWMKLGVVTWDLNGHTYTLTSPTESLRSGMAGASSDLQVNDGTLNTVTVVSGGTSGIGSLGSRFGIGLDATWNNSGDVIVGQGGDGNVNSSGNTTIGGNLHLATTTGDGGFGVSGGTTRTLGNTFIGVGTGDNIGQATVFAGGTWNASGTVQLGGGGSRGGLRVVNGGVANLNNLNSVQGTLDMPDATDMPGGTLNIAGQATFNSYANTNADVQIGTNNTVNSTGDLIFAEPQSHVLVDQNGTWNHNGAVHVGYGGLANISQSNAGPLFSGVTTFNLGSPTGGYGEVTLSGSLSVSDRINMYGGRFVVRTSLPVVSPNPILVNGGELEFATGDRPTDINTPYISLRNAHVDGSGVVDTPIRLDGGFSFLGESLEGPFNTLVFTGSVATTEPNAHFIKQGQSTVHFAGAQSYAAGAQLSVSGGTMILDSDTAEGAGPNLHIHASYFYQLSGGGVDVAHNGVVRLNSSQHLRALTVSSNASPAVHGEVHFAPGGHKIVAPSVRVGQGALLDLADGDMIIDYNSADYPNTIPHSPLTALKQRIAEGYNGGAWDGLGIVTSLGDAEHFGLGYGEAADLGLLEFAGESFDATTALISFTRYGDANLDGLVDDLDVARFNNGMANSLGGWVNGDFNYDGVVNSADGDLLAANYGMSSALAASLVVVPEPGAIALIATSAALLLRRRRRR